MKKPVILKNANELGLNMYETKSYLALLERETLSVTEIAKLAKIPRTAAYEALENLLHKGFCTAKPGKIKQYSAVDPILIKEKALMLMDDMYENKISEIDEKREEIFIEMKTAKKNLTDFYAKIAPLFNNRKTTDNSLNYIEILKDPFQIHKKVVDYMNNAEKEILSFSKPPFTVPRDQLKEQLSSHNKPLKNKVLIKSIYEIPQDPDQKKWILNYISTTSKGGEQIRIIDHLPLKMIIFDEKNVIFQLEDPVIAVPTFTTQFIEHSSLAHAMKLLFHSLWEKALDYKDYQKAQKNN